MSTQLKVQSYWDTIKNNTLIFHPNGWECYSKIEEYYRYDTEKMVHIRVWDWPSFSSLTRAERSKLKQQAKDAFQYEKIVAQSSRDNSEYRRYMRKLYDNKVTLEELKELGKPSFHLGYVIEHKYLDGDQAHRLMYMM